MKNIIWLLILISVEVSAQVGDFLPTSKTISKPFGLPIKIDLDGNIKFSTGDRNLVFAPGLQLGISKSTVQYSIPEMATEFSLRSPEESALLKKLESNLNFVERIYFTGGEPTLIKAHWKLLEKLIETGRAPEVWLDYNTNVSLITDEQLKIWSKFKQVFLGCSIDGIYEKAVYLRPPVEWSVIEKNLEKISRAEGRLKAAFCITVSAYNIFYYPEMLEYLWKKDWKNFDALPQGQVLENPSWMSVQVLPLKTKKAIEEKFRKFFEEKTAHFDLERRKILKGKLDYIIAFMNERDGSRELKTFLRRTDQLDRLRNQKFRETLPELYSLLQN
jgi:organic radical activating enzyme